MAFMYTEKKKTVQEEMAYIAYMIIGSYFHKEICRNKMMVTRLFLYYKEMKEKKQEHKEQVMINQADICFKNYVETFSGMNCESVITYADGRYFIDFFTGFEHVHAEVDAKGKCEIEVII